MILDVIYRREDGDDRNMHVENVSEVIYFLRKEIYEEPCYYLFDDAYTYNVAKGYSDLENKVLFFAKTIKDGGIRILHISEEEYKIFKILTGQL